MLVQKNFELDPFSNSLFLFCGKRNDRIKALYFEGDGFVLLYKRLEHGKFQCPAIKNRRVRSVCSSSGGLWKAYQLSNLRR
ncbi:IS66 family insertion sequence element accessory protein TnpB [Oscillospiraceae bacterium HV4-5-C5C]|nr:IS66 family insertion sequence element accessory protein TnpB [Oscillospiraceae bacterium HV4-5-C5C]